MSDLKLLLKEKRLTTSQGEVVIKPFRFGDFNIVIELIEKYYSVFSGDMDWKKVLFENIEHQNKVLIDVHSLLCLSTRGNTQSWDEFGYDEIISIMSEVIQMNLDFFTQVAQNIITVSQPQEVRNNGEIKSQDLSDTAILGAK